MVLNERKSMNEYIFIMLEDDLGKKYFCKKKHLNEIKEFAENFNLKMFYVKSKKLKALTMTGLARAFCNPNYAPNTDDYIVLSAVKQTAKRPALSVRIKSSKPA